MNTISQRLRKWFLPFVQVQMFLSLISLPVLVAWGLPFSLMTITGNFLFGPFCTAFLLCSSLIFFTELAHVPNGLFVTLLEYITNIWLFFLNCSTKTWLIGFTTNSCLLFFGAAAASLVILQHRRWGTAERSSITLSILFVATLAISKLMYVPAHATIMCNKKSIELFTCNGALNLKDNGGLGEKINPASWVQYTLLAEITKLFGTTHLQTVETSKHSLPTLHALKTLCKEATVKEIIFKELPTGGKKEHEPLQAIVNQGTIIKTVIPK